MIEFFLKCFPVKHVQDLEKKKPKLEKDDGLNKKKRALLVVISWYHPDKVTSAKDADGNRIYNDEDIVIFEEITKCLNSQYENVKGKLQSYVNWILNLHTFFLKIFYEFQFFDWDQNRQNK